MRPMRHLVCFSYVCKDMFEFGQMKWILYKNIYLLSLKIHINEDCIELILLIPLHP